MSVVQGPQSSFDFSGLSELKAQATRESSKAEASKKAAQQFEALFLQMMMKSMRAAVPDGGLLNSKATETFEQMYDQQLVMALSETGTVGLSKIVEDFLSRAQNQEAENLQKKFYNLGSTNSKLPLSDKSDQFQLTEEFTNKFLLERKKYFSSGDE